MSKKRKSSAKNLLYPAAGAFGLGMGAINEARFRRDMKGVRGYHKLRPAMTAINLVGLPVGMLAIAHRLKKKVDADNRRRERLNMHEKKAGYESVLNDPSVAAEIKKSMTATNKATPAAEVKKTADLSGYLRAVQKNPSLVKKMENALRKNTALLRSGKGGLKAKARVDKSYRTLEEIGEHQRNLAERMSTPSHQTKGYKITGSGPQKIAAGEPGVSDDPSVAAEIKKTQGQENAVARLKAKLSQVVTDKKASIDEAFARDLHQLVGLDAPSAVDGWQRPEVKVAGQATDRIDDHMLSWMRDKASADLVKDAASAEEIAKAVLKAGTVRKGGEAVAGHMTGEQIKGALKALAGTAVVGGAAYGGHKLLKRHERGIVDEAFGSKQASVTANPENVDLITRVRAMAQARCRDA